jgi:Fe-S cluster assembly protein SufB
MSETKALESMIGEEYKYGFTTDVEYEDFPKGINEDVVRLISEKKNEPEWMTEFRLKAYRAWTEMEEPSGLMPPTKNRNLIHFSTILHPKTSPN